MNLHIQQILTQMAGFVILIWILKRLAWKPILKMLDERRTKIANEFQTIEDAKKELSLLKGEYESKLAEIELHAQARLREGIKEGEKIAKEIVDKAREESIRLIKEREAEAKKEMEKTLKELQSRIVDLSVMIASKTIGKSLSKEDHLRIINEFVSQTRYLS